MQSTSPPTLVSTSISLTERDLENLTPFNVLKSYVESMRGLSGDGFTRSSPSYYIPFSIAVYTTRAHLQILNMRGFTSASSLEGDLKASEVVDALLEHPRETTSGDSTSPAAKAVIQEFKLRIASIIGCEEQCTYSNVKKVLDIVDAAIVEHFRDTTIRTVQSLETPSQDELTVIASISEDEYKYISRDLRGYHRYAYLFKGIVRSDAMLSPTPLRTVELLLTMYRVVCFSLDRLLINGTLNSLTPDDEQLHREAVSRNTFRITHFKRPRADVVSILDVVAPWWRMPNIKITGDVLPLLLDSVSETEVYSYSPRFYSSCGSESYVSRRNAVSFRGNEHLFVYFNQDMEAHVFDMLDCTVHPLSDFEILNLESLEETECSMYVLRGCTLYEVAQGTCVEVTVQDYSKLSSTAKHIYKSFAPDERVLITFVTECEGESYYTITMSPIIYDVGVRPSSIQASIESYLSFYPVKVSVCSDELSLLRAATPMTRGWLEPVQSASGCDKSSNPFKVSVCSDELSLLRAATPMTRGWLEPVQSASGCERSSVSFTPLFTMCPSSLHSYCTHEMIDFNYTSQDSQCRPSYTILKSISRGYQPLKPYMEVVPNALTELCPFSLGFLSQSVKSVLAHHEAESRKPIESSSTSDDAANVHAEWSLLKSLQRS